MPPAAAMTGRPSNLLNSLHDSCHHIWLKFFKLNDTGHCFGRSKGIGPGRKLDDNRPLRGLVPST
jgi:hypothetical protein